MLMKLPTEVFGDVIVVHAPEEVGGDTAGQFQSLLTSLERNQVVLDLDGTETLDSSGLEAVVGAQEALRAMQGDLKISTGNQANLKILEITRLDKVLEVHESVLEAVKSFV